MNDARRRWTAATASMVLASLMLWTATSEPAVAGPQATYQGPRADPGAQPGAYVGKTQGHYRVTFRIKRAGRQLTGFSTSVVAYYTGPGGVRPEVVPVRFGSTKVRGNGRFAHTYRRHIASDDSTLTVTVRGNIDRGRLNRGTIAYYQDGDGYEVRTDGPQPFRARRR